MGKVVVIYHSYRGITPKLVEALKKGVEKAGGQCETLLANDASPQDILVADTIVFACGQPFGTLAGPVKTFLEKCWNYEGKGQLAGKKYATLFNGNRDPKEIAVYLDGVMQYFKLEKATDGIACLNKDVESILNSCEELGAKLA